MNRSTKISTSAFILIGGQSKRFGYPKWKSKIGEKTLLDHIYNMCSLFDNIFIVGKEKPEGFNKPFVKDEFDFQAPINGIFTALKIYIIYTERMLKHVSIKSLPGVLN